MKEKLVKVKNVLQKAGSVVKTSFEKLIKIKQVQSVINWIKKPFIGYLLLAGVLNFFLEVLSRHSFKKAFVFISNSPTVYLYNVIIIFVTLSLVLFAKRKIFATVFVCAMWVISAFANYIVLSFRTTPFSAIDILMIRNVMTMLDKYMEKWQMVLSVIGIILVIALLVYLYIRLPKTKSKRNPFRASAYVCMSLVVAVTFTKVAVNTQIISDNFGNLAYAYNDYGFAYCFSNSIIDVGIGKPRSYSEATIKEIVEGLNYDKSEVVLLTKEEQEAERLRALTEQQTTESVIDNTEAEADVIDNSAVTEEVTSEEVSSEETSEELTSEANTTETVAATEENVPLKPTVSEYKNEPATKEYPNIIVIQLESIFDTKYMKNFYPMVTPMPTFTRLKRQYSSGLFTVPAVGAGTANTEFEVQTGMSTQFFGAGEYPFKTVMRSVTADSMGYDLKRYGYATAGFHNNDATFYERYIDYSNLGFDVFAGMEHMYELNYTPRGWGKDDVLDDTMIERMVQTPGRDYITTITVQAHGRYPKKYTKTLNDIDCFFTGKYENDRAKKAAWQYYINMCRETDDMLKDLLAKLREIDEPTVVFMYGDHLPALNIEEDDIRDINLYQTEWVMWDNFNLPVVNKDMHSYQASTYIFDRLGLKGGLMQQFHNKYMNSDDQKGYLDKMQMLEYDTLYGNNYAFDGNNPFPRTDMKMGLRDIVVNKCKVIRDEVWIYGKGFNEFTEVYIDGKSVNSTQISYAVIKISLEDFEGGKELYVAQAGDDHVVLSVSNTIELDTEHTVVVTTEEATTEMTSEADSTAEEQ